MEQPNHPQWIHSLRSGDPRAFEALFREHYAPLVRFVRAQVGSLAVAEELVQETFLRVWAGRERLDPARSIRAYLYRAARNQALNHLRHERIERSTHAELERSGERAAEPQESSNPDAAELARAIEQAVAALPERSRLVFRLSREHGLTYAEIAETLGISVRTVETQMGRALRALRESLAPYRPLEPTRRDPTGG